MICFPNTISKPVCKLDAQEEFKKRMYVSYINYDKCMGGTMHSYMVIF